MDQARYRHAEQWRCHKNLLSLETATDVRNLATSGPATLFSDMPIASEGRFEDRPSGAHAVISSNRKPWQNWRATARHVLKN